MSEVDIGLIGAGSIGRIHAKNIMRAKDAKLVAIVDINRPRAEALSKECRVDKVYTDYLEMLDKENPDAVIICTPNYLHARMTIDSLSRGIHAFCEKPMAMNAEEAQAMVDAQRKYQKILMLGMVQRFSCEARIIRKIFQEGVLGRIYYTKVSYLRRMGIPGMGSWFTTKKLSGGGPLADIGPHGIDIALWIQGFPKPVSAKGYTYSMIGTQNKGLGGWGIPEPGGPFDVEDLALGFVEIENGGVMLVELSWALNTIQDTFNCVVCGDKAGACLRPPKTFTEIDGKWAETTIECPQVDTYLEEIQHFVNCVKEGSEPIAPPEEGVVVMKIIDAIYKSASIGKEVPIH